MHFFLEGLGVSFTWPVKRPFFAAPLSLFFFVGPDRSGGPNTDKTAQTIAPPHSPPMEARPPPGGRGGFAPEARMPRICDLEHLKIRKRAAPFYYFADA